jgi:hypothetical protein
VQEFLDAWKKMGLTDRLRERAGDQTLTLEDFLEKPDHYLTLMSDNEFDVRYHLVNRQVYRMGMFRTWTDPRLQFFFEGAGEGEGGILARTVTLH